MRVDSTRAGPTGVDVTTVVCVPFAELVPVGALEHEVAGDHVHLVPGIDRDVEGLIVHLLHDAPTVLVVVHSETLSSARLEAVLSTFAKQRTRNHRLCVVDFDPDDPAAFLAEVEAAVVDMRARAEAESVCTAYSSVSSSQHRRTTVPAPVASARNTPRGARREARSEQSEEFSSAQFDLTATNPGSTESGTTYPDLERLVERVRRGRKDRQTRSVRRRAITALSIGAALSAVAVTVWLRSGSSSDVGPNTRGAAVVSPKPKRFAPTTATSPASVEPRAQQAPRSPSPVVPDARVAAREADESRRIAAALDDGKIHALDALLMRTAARAPEPFSDARRRCEHLDVAGLRGWRIPTLDELRALRRARLLPEGEFWSSSNRARRARHTLSRDVTRPLERSSADGEHATTLCVRAR